MEDCTQVIDISTIGFDISDLGRVKVGTLIVNETPYDIFKGENVIGRDELSDIVLRNNSISSKHAVVEVEDWDTHLLFDCGSTNKTRLGKIFLKPNVRYNLQGGENIMFADLKAKYIKLDKPETDNNGEDSLSDAGSESILNSVPIDLDADLDIANKDQPIPQGQNKFDEDDSRKSYNSFSDLNDSSLLEENKKKAATSKLQIVDASDDSTDDELDFIPPSQTVKEFVSSRQATLKNKCDKDGFADIFENDTVPHIKSVGKNNQGVTNDFLNTQDQEMIFMTEKTSCNKVVNSLEVNSQNLFNTQVQEPFKPRVEIIEDQNIFEAETQDSTPNVIAQKDKVLKCRTSKDIFDAETQVPTLDSSDVEMSDLVLSSAMTEPNTSVPKPNSGIKDNSLSTTITVAGRGSSPEIIVPESRDFLNPGRPTNKEYSETSEGNIKTIVEQNGENQNAVNEEPTSENKGNNIKNSSVRNLVGIVKQEAVQVANQTCNNEMESETINTSYGSNNKSSVIVKVKEEISDPNQDENVTNQGGSIDQSDDNSECETIDIADMLTQANVSLNKKFKTSPSSRDLDNENIFDVCTQVNTSLNSKSVANIIIKEEISIKSELDDLNIAAEETQLNINLPERNKSKTKSKITLNDDMRPDENLLNIENEDTQPNLHLRSLFSESRYKMDQEDDICDLLTQPYIPKNATAITDDSDDTDVDEGSNVLKDEIIDTNTAKEKIEQRSNFDPPNKIDDPVVKSNEHEIDESSNQSDSLLAMIPLDPADLLEQEALQSGIQTASKTKTDIETVREINCESSLRASQNDTTCDVVSKKHEEITTGEMDICSTVGEGTYLSACGSHIKGHGNSEIHRTQTQRSCKKMLPITPLMKEQSKISKSNNLLLGNFASSEKLNHSMVFNEPCGSSTPFRPEDRVVKSGKSSASSVMKTPPRHVTERMVESPELPCTDELAEVATPERQECYSPVPGSSKQRDNVPLALNRTPRMRKVSRKLAETLKEEGYKDVSSLPYPSLLNKKKAKKDLVLEDNSKKDYSCSVPVDRDKKINATKRKSDSPKEDFSGLKMSRDDFGEECLKKIHGIKRMSVNLIDVKRVISTKSETIEPDTEDHSPAKKAKNMEFNKNNLEHPKEDAQSVVKQKSKGTKQKKQIYKSEGKEKISDITVNVPNECQDGKTKEIHELKTHKNGEQEKTVVVEIPENRLDITDNLGVSNGSNENYSSRGNFLVANTSDISPSKHVKGVEGTPPIQEKHCSKRSTRANFGLKSPTLSKSNENIDAKDEDEKTASRKSNRPETTDNLPKKHYFKSPGKYYKQKNITALEKEITDYEEDEKGVPPKRLRHLEKSCDLPRKEPKEKRNVTKKEEKKSPSIVVEDSVQPSTPDNFKNVDSSHIQLKHVTMDSKTKEVKTSVNEHCSTESSKKSSNISGNNIRKSSRRKKESSIEISSKKEISESKLENNSLNGINTRAEQSNNMKLKDGLVETPEMSSRKNNGKRKEDVKSDTDGNVKGSEYSSRKSSRKKKEDVKTDTHGEVKESVVVSRKSNRSKKEDVKSDTDGEVTGSKVSSRKGSRSKKEDLKSDTVRNIKETEVDSRKSNRSKKEDIKSHTDEEVKELEDSSRKSRKHKKEDVISDTVGNLKELETQNKLLLRPNVNSNKQNKIKTSLLDNTDKNDTHKMKLGTKTSSDDVLKTSYIVDDKEKESRSSRSRTSSRSTNKPARFRDRKDIGSSDRSSVDSEKESLSKKRKKEKRDTNSSESVNSVTPEGDKTNINDEHPTFIAPSKSASRDVKNKSEVFKTPIVEDRGRSRTIGNETSRSRSRSDSSQSSFKSDSLPQSPRRLGARGKRVLFTSGLTDPTWESHVKKLGGATVDCPLDCSLLIADKVRRTVKFLCVLGQGKPIVSLDWLVQSWRCTNFAEPMDYLLLDREAEGRFKFSLSQTIEAAKKQPLLKGFSIHATPSVKPPQEDIKSIVECCGGEYLEKVPSKWPENTVIISHVDDKSLWRKFKVRGLTPPVVAAEMLLIGVLQHKLEVEPHRLQ